MPLNHIEAAVLVCFFFLFFFFFVLQISDVGSRDWMPGYHRVHGTNGHKQSAKKGAMIQWCNSKSHMHILLKRMRHLGL